MYARESNASADVKQKLGSMSSHFLCNAPRHEEARFRFLLPAHAHSSEIQLDNCCGTSLSGARILRIDLQQWGCISNSWGQP